MTICPKCSAENRPEAAFCSNCGTILLAQSVQVKNVSTTPVPAPVESTAPEIIPDEPTQPEGAQDDATLPTPAEEVVYQPSFSKRQEGSVFGERFLYDGFVSESEHEFHYTVTEICQPAAPCVRVCSNPECRTIHVPAGAEEEKFCTYCGNLLEIETPILSLQDADDDRFGNFAQIIDLHLVHPNIHPPITTFQEELTDGMHYSLVRPFSKDLPMYPEIDQVMKWGQQLASSLDYLQSNGIVFGEELNPASFGLVENKIVWRDFNSVRILPILADREKINNIRLLALSLYSWITGRVTFSPDTSLNPRLNQLFHQALVGEGFTSGVQFAQQIDQAMKAGLTIFNIDYHVGQRTHPGQIRAVNEDSLLCFGISKVQQGISQPTGIFAISDGMGGHSTGDIASSVAVQSLAQKASLELLTLQNRSAEGTISWLKQVIQEANQAVYESRQKANNDMGATLACAFLAGNQAYLAHVGDTRIYLIREGSIQQLTTDHTVVQQLVAIGKIGPDEARQHPQRNVIYRSLGEKPQVEVDIYTQAMQPGDRLLLCSDGLHSMLEDQKMQIIIHESPSPQVACDYLIDAANLAGGEDNITIIIVEVIAA